MTTIHQVFTIRSFRNADDKDFAKAIQIYDANTHSQVKTDSREIAHWLHHREKRPNAKFYICGLYISGALVGFVEFIYLRRERLIHFDYFVIQAEKRSAGAFYTFTEEMRSFFEEEQMEWDFITAEVAHLAMINGISRYAQRLVRLFRQIGFSEILIDFEQPLLGVEHQDTACKATLVLLPRVEMDRISRSRFLELISAIYYKHYVEWYSIYPNTIAQYRARVDFLFGEMKRRVAEFAEIPLRGPDRDFVDSEVPKNPPLHGVLMYAVKIVISGFAAGAFHVLLRHYTEFPLAWLVGIPACAFILLAITVSLTDKKRFESFKLLVSLVSKFFDR